VGFGAVVGYCSSSVGSLQRPHPDVVLNKVAVPNIREAPNRAQLTVDVFLVLQDCVEGSERANERTNKRRDQSVSWVAHTIAIAIASTLVFDDNKQQTTTTQKDETRQSQQTGRTVGLSRKHGFRRRVLRADVYDGKRATGLQDAVGFPKDLFSARPGSFVKRVHDGNQIEGFAREARPFGVSQREFGSSRVFSFRRGGKRVAVLVVVPGSLLVAVLVALAETGHQGPDKAEMVRQKAGHVDHFGRRVQADHQFGIRKGVLQRTGRYPHATTHVQNLGIPTGLRVAGHDHPRKPFRDLRIATERKHARHGPERDGER